MYDADDDENGERITSEQLADRYFANPEVCFKRGFEATNFFIFYDHHLHSNLRPYRAAGNPAVVFREWRFNSYAYK
jgi:hypothetical protein